MKKSLRGLRLERGWSQLEVAIRVGVSVTTVRSWETKAARPGEFLLAELSEVFGVPAEDIDLAEPKKMGPRTFSNVYGMRRDDKGVSLKPTDR